MKKFKIVMSLLLVFGLLFSGLSVNLKSVEASDKNPEFTKLKLNLEKNGLLYITENNIDSQKIINFNKEFITTNFSTIKSLNIAQVDSNIFKNIIVDATELNNTDVLNKVRESYKNGAKIVIRKDHIKLSEAYNLIGENIPENIPQVDNYSDKLTNVAISMFKDSSGNIYPVNMNVEVNNENEVLRIITIALRDDKDNLHLSNNQQTQSIIQTIKPAKASLSTSWPPVGSYASYDSWTSVTVNYALNVYKNPNNPSNGTYWSMAYSPVTVTPNSGYYSGYVYLYQHSNSGGTVCDYGPTAQTNTSAININFGVTPSVTLNYGIGNRMNIAINAGGLGNYYIQWRFTPVSILGGYQPTSNQTAYEPTSQYYQYQTYISHSLRYIVDMYTFSNPDFNYYGSASMSQVSVNGY
ncbi:MAG: hypothetical protein WA113_12925 [Desulfitobacteriaceae bacterium]